MAKRVNDLISLIASQDQPGCSPGTLSGVGEPCYFFQPTGQINVRCDNLLVFFGPSPYNPNFRLKKTVKAKSELKIYWVS